MNGRRITTVAVALGLQTLLTIGTASAHVGVVSEDTPAATTGTRLISAVTESAPTTPRIVTAVRTSIQASQQPAPYAPVAGDPAQIPARTVHGGTFIPTWLLLLILGTLPVISLGYALRSGVRLAAADAADLRSSSRNPRQTRS